MECRNNMASEIEAGGPRTGDDSPEVEFFGKRDIPELSLERVTHGQIALMFEHYRDPGRAADFD